MDKTVFKLLFKKVTRYSKNLKLLKSNSTILTVYSSTVTYSTVYSIFFILVTLRSYKLLIIANDIILMNTTPPRFFL